MTENEAIKVLKMIETHGSLSTNAKELSIQALEEIQQYRAIGTVKGYERAIEVSQENYNLYREYKDLLREYEAIGTVEEFKALKEKIVAKKVIRLSDNGYYDYKCPACGMPDKDCMGKRYCNCGQALET